MADRIGCQLGLKQLPEILLVPFRLSPLVWSIGGRVRVVLPDELLDRLDTRGRQTLVAHELAHLRRKDHLVRLLELSATTLFWWHPVVWWASRKLRELEEQCCDAMVLDVLPASGRQYATALLDTLDFLSETSIAVPVGGTSAKPGISLARRIKMLNNKSTVLRLTRGRFLLLAAAAVVPLTLAVAAEPPRKEKGQRTSPQTSAPKIPPTPARGITAKANSLASRNRLVCHVDNMPVKDVADTLNELLRSEGTAAPSSPIVVVADVLSNNLLLSGPQDELDQIEQMIRQIDQPKPTVVIEMLIAQATKTSAKPRNPDKAPSASPWTRILQLKTLEDLATEGSIEERFEELSSRKQLRILSRPHIRTLDEQPAFIRVTSRAAIAGKDVDNQPRRKDGQEVGVTVGVTPRVTSDRTVIMEIDVDVSQLRMVESAISETGLPRDNATAKPRIVTTSAQTTLSVSDGRTVVVGGLTDESDTPDEELVIILTPRVIQQKAESAKNTSATR